MASSPGLSNLYFKALSGSPIVYADVDPFPWPTLKKDKPGAIRYSIATSSSPGSGNVSPGIPIVQDSGEDISHAILELTFEEMVASTFTTLRQLRRAGQPILISPDNGNSQEYQAQFLGDIEMGVRRRLGAAPIFAGTIKFKLLSQTIGSGGLFDPPTQTGGPS